MKSRRQTCELSSLSPAIFHQIEESQVAFSALVYIDQNYMHSFSASLDTTMVGILVKTKKGLQLGSVVEWLERRDCEQHSLDSKPTLPILLCLGKVTLRHFPLLDGVGEQFHISVICL